MAAALPCSPSYSRSVLVVLGALVLRQARTEAIRDIEPSYGIGDRDVAAGAVNNSYARPVGVSDEKFGQEDKVCRAGIQMPYGVGNGTTAHRLPIGGGGLAGSQALAAYVVRAGPTVHVVGLGAEDEGNVGDGTQPARRCRRTATDWNSIDARRAASSNNTMWCWGANYYGRWNGTIDPQPVQIGRHVAERQHGWLAHWNPHRRHPVVLGQQQLRSAR